MTKKYFKKILAYSPKDLQIVSALCSGSKLKVGSDIKYLPKNKIFLLSLVRKDKENKGNHINTILRFSFIDKFFLKNVSKNNPDKILELITINVLKKNQNYEIILFFSENSYISLKSEIIEVEFLDQTKVE